MAVGGARAPIGSGEGDDVAGEGPFVPKLSLSHTFAGLVVGWVGLVAGRKRKWKRDAGLGMGAVSMGGCPGTLG